MEGALIWITGLAGSGKTTIAKEVCSRLKGERDNVVHLDGDQMRDVLTNEYAHKYGHTIQDRKATAHIYAKLAASLVSQGIIVVVSTISLFHEIHDFNRKHNPRYIEVLVQASQEELLRRTNVKNVHNPNQHLVYSRTNDVVGVHQTPELPREPTLVVQNDRPEDVQEIVEKIIMEIEASS